MITYFQAIIIGLLQGITELFPISSLGHSVLLPSLFGWNSLAAEQTQTDSHFLAFLVGLHVATALALLWFYRQEWNRIIRGFFGSVTTRKIDNNDARLAWLIIIASIPVGLVALVFEHSLREIFAKPLAAACFLVLNGLILIYGDHLLKKNQRKRDYSLATTTSNLSKLGIGNATIVGSFQIAALFAGISRSGATMVGGLWRGLDHEDAARFSFLLATPIILAAGIYKLPDLLSANAADVRGQVLVGSIAAAIAAYFTVRFLDKFFRTNKLTPFGVYCIAFGVVMIIKLSI